jgi:hypothetical protein
MRTATQENRLRLLVGLEYRDWRLLEPGKRSRRAIRDAGRRAADEALEVCGEQRGAILGISVGNEIPADVVRLHGISPNLDVVICNDDPPTGPRKLPPATVSDSSARAPGTECRTLDVLSDHHGCGVALAANVARTGRALLTLLLAMIAACAVTGPGPATSRRPPRSARPRRGRSGVSWPECSRGNRGDQPDEVTPPDS